MVVRGKLNNLQAVCKSKKKRQDGKQSSSGPHIQDKSHVNKVQQESDESGSDGEYVNHVGVEYEINHIKGNVKQFQEKND